MVAPSLFLSDDAPRFLKPGFYARNGMRTLLRTLAGAVAVAVVGFALARYGAGKTTASPPPLDRQASVADFKVNYPSTWRVAPAATVPLVPMGDVLTLAAGGSKSSRLVIGTQQTDHARGAAGRGWPPRCLPPPGRRWSRSATRASTAT